MLVIKAVCFARRDVYLWNHLYCAIWDAYLWKVTIYIVKVTILSWYHKAILKFKYIRHCYETHISSQYLNVPLEVNRGISAAAHEYPIMKLSTITFFHYSRFSQAGKTSQNKRARRTAW